jgi:hypothetical protein
MSRYVPSSCLTVRIDAHLFFLLGVFIYMRVCVYAVWLKKARNRTERMRIQGQVQVHKDRDKRRFDASTAHAVHVRTVCVYVMAVAKPPKQDPKSCVYGYLQIHISSTSSPFAYFTTHTHPHNTHTHTHTDNPTIPLLPSFLPSTVPPPIAHPSFLSFQVLSSFSAKSSFPLFYSSSATMC